MIEVLFAKWFAHQYSTMPQQYNSKPKYKIFIHNVVLIGRNWNCVFKCKLFPFFDHKTFQLNILQNCLPNPFRTRYERLFCLGIIILRCVIFSLRFLDHFLPFWKSYFFFLFLSLLFLQLKDFFSSRSRSNPHKI